MIDRVRATWRFFMDPRASLSIKLMFIAAIAYVVWPLDLIPDIPIFGWFDDIGLFGIATAFLLSAIRPYRADSAAGVDAAEQQRQVQERQVQRQQQEHDQSTPRDAQPTEARRAERPIVTEVWGGRGPKQGGFGRFRGPNYLVETDGSDQG